jgi:AcrR family transcriptional regulator
MLRAAADLFVNVGFAGATMDDVAQQAEVAVQTLYYSFRTKGQLLIEAVEYLASGQIDPQPVMDRTWVQQVMTASEAGDVIDLVVEHGTAIYRGVAPLLPAIRAASGDNDVASYWQATAKARRAGMRRMIGHLDELGALSRDPEEATDLLFALSSHETYRSLVVEAGWSEPKYISWLAATLRDQLTHRSPAD